MNALLLVAIGGAFGSSLRYLVITGAARLFGTALPWGTFAVNVAGSFVMGLLVEFMFRKTGAGEAARLLLGVGFLGGFTTFSAFSIDAVSLLERGAFVTAILYIAGSVAVSLLALAGGLALARQIAV